MSYDRRKVAKIRNVDLQGFETGIERIIKRFEQGDASASRQLEFYQKMLLSEAEYHRKLADFLRNTSQVIMEPDVESAHDVLSQLRAFAHHKPRG